ncbi:MAG: DMT family transporter [Flavobacteriales bacterium]
MHLIVILLGFTGVLGKLIHTSSDVLVWYRMLFALLLIAVYLYFTIGFKIKKVDFIKIFGVGLVVAAHWLFFFESIKISNVSIAVVCMGTSSLFSTFLEPIILKRKVILREFILGLVVLLAIGVAMNAESTYIMGFVYGIIAAFLATIFTIYNGIYISKVEAEKITFIEMLAGLMMISVYFLFKQDFSISSLKISTNDVIYLIVLGGLCTSFAFVVSVEVMKKLSAYNVIMAVNLEPIYSILLALIIFGDSESMNLSFYVGSLIIIAAVFIDGYLKNKALK